MKLKTDYKQLQCTYFSISQKGTQLDNEILSGNKR